MVLQSRKSLHSPDLLPTANNDQSSASFPDITKQIKNPKLSAMIDRQTVNPKIVALADAIINDSSRNEDDEYSLQPAKRLKTGVDYREDEPERKKIKFNDYVHDVSKMSRTKTDIMGYSDGSSERALSDITGYRDGDYIDEDDDDNDIDDDESSDGDEKMDCNEDKINVRFLPSTVKGLAER